MSYGKKLLAGSLAVATLAGAGVVGATVQSVTTSGSSGNRARVACPGGMSRLGHDVNENMSLFPGDPAVQVRDLYTVDVDYFKVEDLDLGTHAGTHIDVPSHFIEGGRTLDQFAAEEFLWPAYKIDVRGMSLTDGFVEISDIQSYEAQNGRIRSGSLVVLQTGAEAFFGAEETATAFAMVDDPTQPILDEQGDPVLDEYGDPTFEQMVKIGGDGEPFVISDNTDDVFDFLNAGFSEAAVQWLFDNRNIDGVGSDAYGPDSYADADFLATYTALVNDGVALVGLKNLDSVSVRSDVIMAPAVNLTDGSGFSVDPLACHGVPPRPSEGS